MNQPETDALLNDVFRRPLGDADAAAIERALAAGTAAPGTAARIADLLRRFSLVLELVKVSEAVSLDTLLPRLMTVITEAMQADRATLFLYDDETRELFSRIVQGEGVTEIRIPRDAGIAAAVFAAGRAEIIPDAYADSRFNATIDRATGYRTRNILCVPLRNRANEVIGVTQVLNKHGGAEFDRGDQALLEAITAQAAAALEHARLFEKLERARHDEARLLEVTESISSELHIDQLLGRIVNAVTALLDAERSTLFVHDKKTRQLWSRVAEGAGMKEIRIPADAGIAGAAFSRRQLLNIPDAYADPRFNPEVDRRTGYRTRSILTVPVIDRAGTPVGVVQALNKRGGPFGPLDERRLKAFSAQIAIAIQNAQLFADVLALKNYNESILKSLSNGVVTLDEERRVVKLNEAAKRILGVADAGLAEATAESVFGERNAWVLKSLETVAQKGGSDYIADTDYLCGDGRRSAVNLTVNALRSIEGETIGYMLVFEDITREKRMRGTMARYMAKEVVEKLLDGGEEVLKGNAGVATILFSDIRRFTSIAETLTARQTVEMLNEYFTEMVEVIFQHGGILDKYIGDAIMAVFGAPLQAPEDASNAVRVANEMIRALRRHNTRRAAHGLPSIEIGIGLATGEVLAGSIGSAKRLEYTVIGDSVNLASRLEGATKHYGTAILMDGATVAGLQGPGLRRRVDLLRVKGKARPAEVYESLDHHDETTFPNLERVIDLFNRGIDFYGRRDWTGAIDCFATALEYAPQDGPSKVYLNRCQYYREHPPAEPWDGVWAMTEK
jgi:adenylate cyclase